MQCLMNFDHPFNRSKLISIIKFIIGLKKVQIYLNCLNKNKHFNEIKINASYQIRIIE